MKHYKLYNYFNESLIKIMNSKKIILCAILLGLFCLLPFAHADNTISIPNPGPSSFTALLNNIVSYVSGLIATLAVIMIVISGILYLTSGGIPSRTEAAKKCLLYAVAGIAVALAASGIVATINAIL